MSGVGEWLGMVNGILPNLIVCCVRLLPLFIVCSLYGGHIVPAVVRVGIVASMTWLVYQSGAGYSQPARLDLEWLAICAQEALLGVVIALIALLPFESARIGGRLGDLFRGASSEVLLPGTGARDSASGEHLHSLVLALSVSWVSPVILHSVLGSYGAIPVGAGFRAQPMPMMLLRLATGAMSTGLAIGAPIAAVSLVVDLIFGLASRLVPQVRLTDASASVRLLAGGAVFWLAIGVASQRLLANAAAAPMAIKSLGGME